MEMLIVVILIGILSSIAVPNFTGMRERALGREAQANLRLIAAAERVYELEMDTYYASSDIDEINDNLKLALTEENWNYNITGGGGGFTATATRPGCTYTMDQDDPGPVAGGGCP